MPLVAVKRDINWTGHCYKQAKGLIIRVLLLHQFEFVNSQAN